MARKKEEESNVMNYYEAVRIAYIESEYMQKYLDTAIKNIIEINKTFRPIWEFTYKISGGEEARVRVVKRSR